MVNSLHVCQLVGGGACLHIFMVYSLCRTNKVLVFKRKVLVSVEIAQQPKEIIEINNVLWQIFFEKIRTQKEKNPLTEKVSGKKLPWLQYISICQHTPDTVASRPPSSGRYSILVLLALNIVVPVPSDCRDSCSASLEASMSGSEML